MPEIIDLTSFIFILASPIVTIVLDAIALKTGNVPTVFKDMFLNSAKKQEKKQTLDEIKKFIYDFLGWQPKSLGLGYYYCFVKNNNSIDGFAINDLIKKRIRTHIEADFFKNSRGVNIKSEDIDKILNNKEIKQAIFETNKKIIVALKDMGKNSLFKDKSKNMTEKIEKKEDVNNGTNKNKSPVQIAIFVFLISGIVVSGTSLLAFS